MSENTAAATTPPGRRALNAALLALGCLALQNLDELSRWLLGIERNPLAVAHLHWGVLLAIAMLSPQRLYLRVGFAAVLLGWIVRNGLRTGDASVATLSALVLLHVLMYVWTLACARWMGWPRAQAGVRVRDLAPYAGLALLAYPLGWGLAYLGLASLLAGHWWQGGLAETAWYIVFTHSFGVTCATLPLLLLGSGRERLARSRVSLSEQLLLAAYLALLGLVLSGLALTPGAVLEMLLELRFLIAIGLVWAVMRLPWTAAAVLMGLTSLLLPAAAGQLRPDSADDAWRISRLALEMGALQLLLALAMLAVRDNLLAHRRAEDESRRDSVSGVPNVNALRQDLHQRAQPPGEIACLGIERLDAMMAGLGLAAQEALAAAIHQHLAPRVNAYTLGMGRFALLPAGARADWQADVIDALERFHFDYIDTPVRIEPHLGVCPLHGTATADIGAALHTAYGAMLSAYQRGEMVPVFAAEAPPAAPARASLATHALALALVRQQQIELHVQPIRRIDGASARMGEILCRLRRPDGRLLLPAQYIAELTASRSMVELDRQVVLAVLAFLRTHPEAAGFNRLCVNLTGLSLVSEHFRAFLLQQLDAEPSVTSRLCFELTEHAIDSDYSQLLPLLDALRERGCLLALDDFGTGMQSFERLQRLNVDLVKIDGLFIRHITQTPRERELVRAMTHIAHAYGAQTVAEHIEDAAALEVLRELGIHWGQGYYLGKPAPLLVNTVAPINELMQ